jgi:tetratricopeptide (TPR) repeat protein
MPACAMPDAAAPARAQPAASARSSRIVWLAACALVLATAAAYSNSFSGPFVFDDTSSIVSNPTIRSLWPPWEALSTPRVGVTVGGRPILNFSLALNYAFSGTSVTGYHVGNLLIHLGAALALFGLLRRTLTKASAGGWTPQRPWATHLPETDVTLLAFAIAALWAVHPLQTESVTYLIQRAESLMGLFYLLTLYSFARATDHHSATSRRLWLAASIASCFLGMGAKEVMVSAPVLVLLYDRTFVAGSFAAALRVRTGYYAGLAATWLYLGYLVASTGGTRGGSAGFGVGVGWGDYLLTQFPAIAHYLRLALWPHPLVFEYGTYWVEHITEILPSLLVVLALIAATVWAFPRRPALGFLGVFFFAILSVTSLVPGTTQMIVEHRMYLPLAAVLTAVALGLHRWLGQGSRWVLLGLGGAAIVGTFARNTVYRSDLALWQDTVARRPRNALAHEMLAQAWSKAGRNADAILEHEAALGLHPTFPVAHSSLADELFRLGRLTEALPHYEAALRAQPDYVDAHHGLALTLARLRRPDEAIRHMREALRLRPEFAEAHFTLGNLLADGRPTEALAEYETAVRQKPDYAEALFNLANTLADVGRPAEALPRYEAALRARPDYAAAHFNLANTLVGLGRRREAIPHYEAAIKQRPDYFDAQVNLGAVLYEEHRTPEAIVRFEEALRLRPGADDIRATLRRLRATP